MYSHFELFSRILIYERRAINRVFLYLGGKRNRPFNFCVITKCCVYDLLNRKVKDFRFVSSDPNTQSGRHFFRFGSFRFGSSFLFFRYFCFGSHCSFHQLATHNLRPATFEFIAGCQLLVAGYLITLVTTPAPTVLPPSRIAKRCSFSRATGATNFTVKVAVSPGIIISTPSARVTSPVTSVVRI